MLQGEDEGERYLSDLYLVQGYVGTCKYLILLTESSPSDPDRVGNPARPIGLGTGSAEPRDWDRNNGSLDLTRSINFTMRTEILDPSIEPVSLVFHIWRRYRERR